MPAMEVVVAIKSLFPVIVAAVVLAASGPAFAQSPTQPTGSWAVETPSSGVAYNLSSPYGGSASDGTYMYIFGGYQYGAYTSYPQYYQACRRYDPANNAWVTLGLMAYPNYYNAGAYYNGRVYSFGGYNLNQGWVATWQSLNISTNTWSQGSTNMSSPRYYHSVAEMNGTIYMTAGYNPYSGPVTTHEAFNPSTGQWTGLTSLPAYQYNHSLAAVPALGKLYSTGGYTPQGYTGINYEYTPQDNDPLTNDVGGTWVTRAQISNGASVQNLLNHRTVTLNNRVYVCAGQNANTGIIQACYEYNPFSNQWAQRANLNYLHYMHAAVAINGKAYVYGGPNYPTQCEEFTPPNFGSAPNPPSAVIQSGPRPETSSQAQADPNVIDGWTNNQITFSADVTDPDAGQQIRMRVQIKPATALWTQTSQVVNLDSGLKAQGPTTLAFNIPAGLAYDWRWRVEDTFANSFPTVPGTWNDAFDNANSPDFRSDQEPPADPVAQAPHNVDIQVNDPVQGAVLLSWVESTDNAPSVGIQYELQVATDGGFNGIEAQIFSPAGTSEFPTTLTVSRFNKFWRVRAQDIGGNFSQWSAPLTFRVTFNDGIDHSAGDAKKACGFTAGAAPALGSALLGAVILSLALLRRILA
jgi:hypothetical protein